MSFQIGGAILDFVVLSILNKEDQYGYTLTKEVREILDISETALYPALRRLQKDELLLTYDKAHQGRNRRYYQLTDLGRERLASYQEEWKSFKDIMDTLNNLK